MPYTFRLVFHGLCAFIPNRRFNNFDANGNLVNPPNQVRVILKNLSLLTTGLNGNGLLPHHSFLDFSKNDLIPAATSRNIDFVFKPGQSGERSICHLLKEDVTIRPGGQEPAASSLTIVNRRPQDPKQPTLPGEENLIFWLATLGRAAQHAGLARSKFVNPLQNNETEVAARFNLKVGQLRTFKLSNRIFRFSPAVNGVVDEHKMATKIALEFPNVPDNDTFTLAFTKFGGGPATTLTFGRRQAAGLPREVEVNVKNREMDEFLGVMEANDLVDGSEFSVFYDLLQSPPQQQPLPRALNAAGGFAAIPSGPRARGNLRTLCPPAGATGST